MGRADTLQMLCKELVFIGGMRLHKSKVKFRGGFFLGKILQRTSGCDSSARLISHRVPDSVLIHCIYLYTDFIGHFFISLPDYFFMKKLQNYGQLPYSQWCWNLRRNQVGVFFMGIIKRMVYRASAFG